MSTLAGTILTAIERARMHPNGKERNKVISRLEDAHVWAERLERNASDATPMVHPNPHVARGTTCTCKPGMVDIVDCPVHKQL